MAARKKAYQPQNVQEQKQLKQLENPTPPAKKQESGVFIWPDYSDEEKAAAKQQQSRRGRYGRAKGWV